ncbi:DUF3365 domain-containing protein [Psychrosphaera sp.]|nr:DUF3365 domain-containing protein [Psychrosphaera sp.]
MKKLIIASAVLVLGSLPVSAETTVQRTELQPAETQSADVDEAKKRIQVFSKTLKSKLKAAISEGGLSKGISVCKTQAPKIAADLSTDGWHVSRTSLKTRNPLNVPDEWELETLKYLESEKASGSDFKALNKTQYKNNKFRYMQAIPTGGLCLSCHGENVSDEVNKALAEHYPNDHATGFKLGDIRGAFSLEKEYLESL